jgi:hypothetical protein
MSFPAISQLEPPEQLHDVGRSVPGPQVQAFAGEHS